MWNPFRRSPDPPRLLKRIEHLELGMIDMEDTLEKVLYQQQRLLGKVNARHKRDLKVAEEFLDEPAAVSPPQGPVLHPGGLKAELRQRAAALRRH